MLELSPERMASLAANASAALESLEHGNRSEPVVRGLSEGEQFCAFLAKGTRQHARTESFSAAGLEAGEFFGLVCSTTSGKDLADRVDTVLEQIRMLRVAISRGLSLDKSTQLGMLREYFYTFAMALAHQEALRDRLARELESRD